MDGRAPAVFVAEIARTLGSAAAPWFGQIEGVRPEARMRRRHDVADVVALVGAVVGEFKAVSRR